MNTTSSPRGFLILELLLAIAFFALTMSGIALVASGGQTMGLDVGLSKGGIGYTLSSLQKESQQGSVLGAFTALVDGTDSYDVYAGTRKVSTISPCMKAVEQTSTWGSEHNRSLSATLATLVPSIEIAQAFGGGCDPLPPSDWDNPDSFGSVDVGGAPGTGIAARWINGSRYAFLTVNPSSAAAEDFYVFNVTDAHNPSLVKKINTGLGLNEIAVAGNYAFVLQDDDENQLQVINISNPANPSVETEVSLQDVDGTYPEGRVIAYYDQKLYIGTWNNNVPANSPEFLIYDVSSPTLPAFVGSLNLGHSINDMTVDGSYTYLATTDDAGELTIVDVATNPSVPTVVGVYNASGVKDGESIALAGNVVYLGRQRVTTVSGDYDFLAIDTSNHANPQLLGQLRLGMNPNTAVTGVAVQGPYAFIGTNDTNDEFRVLSVSDPAHPAPYGCPPYNYSAKITDLFYMDNLIFAANESNDAFRIIYDDPVPSCH